MTKHVVYKSRMSHCGNEGAAFEAVDKVFFLFPTQLEHILNQKGFESAPISWVKINKKTWKRVTSIFHFWVHFTLSCVLKQTACVYIYFGKQKTAKKNIKNDTPVSPMHSFDIFKTWHGSPMEVNHFYL